MVKPSILPEGGKKEAPKGKEAALPAFAVIPLGSDLPAKYDEAEAEPIPVVQRPRKFGVCLCVSMILTLLLIIGLVAAMFLGHASGKYQFRCGVVYGDNEEHTNEIDGTLDEDVEIDPYEGYEQIEIPEQDYCERLTILHDFTVNMTAYRLRRSEVCYVTYLDKEIVMGPDEFIERAEENPEFLTDHYETVHETYRAVLPELSRASLNDGRFGFYIPLLCGDVETYWIEKIPADELQAWEEYWASQDREDSSSSEEDRDWDDSDEEDSRRPYPAHRRRRAAVDAAAVKNFRAFEGRKLSDVKIYAKEAVEAFKKAMKKN